MLSQALLTAILSLAGVMIGAGLQHYFGRALESRRQLTVQKGQSYVDFFKAVALLAQEKNRGNLAMAADAKVRVCIYGSPKVISRLSSFEDAGARINSPEIATMITDLLREMREDVGLGATDIMEQDLMKILFGPKLRPT